MRIEWKKGADGQATLICTREDGSSTWQKLSDFFPRHDLTHLAVEETLGFREAFFGLIADALAIADFADPDVYRKLPTEALWAEMIVHLLDQERAGPVRTTEEFNLALEQSLAGFGTTMDEIPETELLAIRARRDELFARWDSLGPGESLSVDFA